MDPDERKGAWCAIPTTSRCEKLAGTILTSIGVTYLLPLGKRVSRWKDRDKLIQWPLFPGYCFLQREQMEQIRTLPNPDLMEILIFADAALKVLDQEEGALLERISLAPDYCTPHCYSEEGTPVEVVSGHFAGTRGLLIDPQNSLLVLSLPSIRRSVLLRVRDELRERPITR
ncbi:transcription termination/antitermination NusG family protein [Candidatus Nitrospira bockiana]